MSSRPRTLFLHAGLQKTGTSYIQAALRGTREALLAQGIDYARGHDADITSPTGFSSGNAVRLFRDAERMAATLRRLAEQSDRSILLSSETIFVDLHATRLEARLSELAEELGFASVEVLLLVRDPVSHACSIWQQVVKQGGYLGSVDELFPEYEFPRRVAQFLDRLAPLSNIRVTLRNYSRIKNDLLAEVADWLGVDGSVLHFPAEVRVNRPLTRAELELQLALNRRFGKCFRLIALPLCERLPDLRAEVVTPPVELQRQMWQRLEPAIEEVNAHLPETHRCRFDPVEPQAEPTEFCFTREQMDVIAAGFFHHAETLERRNANLSARVAALSRAAGDADDRSRRAAPGAETGAGGLAAACTRNHRAAHQAFFSPWKNLLANLDYRLHKSLSKSPVLPAGLRARLARAAIKRRQRAVPPPVAATGPRETGPHETGPHQTGGP